jgi:hypothetical protein
MEDLGALLRFHRAPGLEALPGGIDGGVDLVDAAARDLRDRRLVDRRDVRERVGGADPFTADPVVGRDLDALDLNRPPAQRASPPPESFVSERYGRSRSSVKPRRVSRS